MGRALLLETAAHVVAGGVASAGQQPARKQPAPPRTLRPSADELSLKNEDGSMTAFDALTPAQRFEFDVRGYFVLRGHYSPAQVAAFNAGIDEVQALPMTHANYTRIGPMWPVPQDRAALDDATHAHWTARTVAEDAAERKQTSMSLLIAGSTKFDPIVRDSLMKEIHRELAGGECMLSGNYYIEKHGPCPGGGLHHGGFPRMRTFRYAFDHTTGKFDCFSTKATIILSDMSTLEKGPFAVIAGSHKANLDPRTHQDLSDATRTLLAEPVFASPGDVIVFTEGITHNAYPVQDRSRRRSLFFNWVPSIDRDNIPHMRMSPFPAHVLERLQDEERQLTAAGWI